MKILGIETSCDDTAIAILEVLSNNQFKIKSNLVSSQVEVHKKFGGVYPMLAKREHQKNLVPIFIKALKETKMLTPLQSRLSNSSKNTLKEIFKHEPDLFQQTTLLFQNYKKPDIDLIAVTKGPGLEPCLWVGMNFVRALSFYWNLPVIPVNHIESHILVNFINPTVKKTNKKQKLFPAIALVASGGHTQLILIKEIGRYEILGETRDDAAGECFDKCAKILGLEYPGGPIISKLAQKGYLIKDKILNKIKFPRPMINVKNYDFSFSGLKTAVLYFHLKQPEELKKSKRYIIKMAYEIQKAIIEVLIAKTFRAVSDFGAQSIILGGGVSANQELRKQFKLKIKKEKLKINLFFPPQMLCTDNALMTAITGYFHQKEVIPWEKLEADANLRIT